MLQLGLLRVITWPGSRFKKQRINAQIICTHPLFVMFSKPKLSWSYVRPCLSLCSDFLVMIQILMICFEQAVIFCFGWGFIRPLSFWFCYPCFLPELFPFLELQSAGCPSFVSLLHGFWLNGFFFILKDNDCLSLLIIRNHHCLSFFRKDLFGAICYALGSTERLPCPRLWLRVLIFENKKLLLLWLEGVDEGLSSL